MQLHLVTWIFCFSIYQAAFSLFIKCNYCFCTLGVTLNHFAPDQNPVELNNEFHDIFSLSKIILIF